MAAGARVLTGLAGHDPDRLRLRALRNVLGMYPLRAIRARIWLRRRSGRGSPGLGA